MFDTLKEYIEANEIPKLENLKQLTDLIGN